MTVCSLNHLVCLVLNLSLGLDLGLGLGYPSLDYMYITEWLS